MKFSLILASQFFVASVAIAAEGPAPQAAAEAPAAQQAAPAEAMSTPAVPEAAPDDTLESICKLSNNTRRVKLDMSKEKCQVLYYKETEKPGTEDKLWEFAHEFDKCKQNYSNFVDKLRGMSWTCN